MKYIDAETLYREVDRLMAHYATAEKEMEDDVELSIFFQGKRKMCSEIINHITALQEEQPEVDLENIIRVEFGTRAKVEYGRRCVKLHWDEFSILVGRFYELGRNARKEVVDLEKAARYVYESWMGGTMDGFRRDIVELGKVLNAKRRNSI